MPGLYSNAYSFLPQRLSGSVSRQIPELNSEVFLLFFELSQHLDPIAGIVMEDRNSIAAAKFAPTTGSSHIASEH